MLRARLAALAFGSGLGLVSGCLNLSDHPLFHRHCDTCAAESGCCEEGGCCGAEGPVLGDCGAPAPCPTCPAPGGYAPAAPIGPPLTAPPRLVPQPQAVPAQPAPYVPGR